MIRLNRHSRRRLAAIGSAAFLASIAPTRAGNLTGVTVGADRTGSLTNPQFCIGGGNPNACVSPLGSYPAAGGQFVHLGDGSSLSLTVGGVTKNFPAWWGTLGTAATQNVGTTAGTVASGAVDPIARSAVQPGADLSAFPVTDIGGLPFTLAGRSAWDIRVKSFGAICDGASHPLSGTYATLAAAQAVYPQATSLSQETDGAAAQKALTTVLMLANGADLVFPWGACRLDRNLSGTVPTAAGLRIRGAGKATRLQFVAGIDGFTLQLAPSASATQNYASRNTLEISDLDLQTGNTSVGNTAVSVSLAAAGSGTYQPGAADRVALNRLTFEPSSGGQLTNSPGAWAFGATVLDVRYLTARDDSFYGGKGDTSSVGIYVDGGSAGIGAVADTFDNFRMTYGGTGLQFGSSSTTAPIQGMFVSNYSSLGNQNDIVAQVSPSATPGQADELSVVNSQFGSSAQAIFTNYFRTLLIANNYFAVPQASAITDANGIRVNIDGNTFNGSGTNLAVTLNNITTSGGGGTSIENNTFGNYGAPPVSLTGSTCGILVQGNTVASAGVKTVSDTSSCANTFARGTINNVVGFNYEQGTLQARAPLYIEGPVSGGTPGNGMGLAGSATGSPVGVQAYGNDSAVGLYLAYKGTGYLTVVPPDGTATGGNTPGQYAVNLQGPGQRGIAAQTASGTNSFVGPGRSSAATASFANAQGNSNTASGLYTSAWGGIADTASGQGGVVQGQYAIDRGRFGARCFASGGIASVQGSAQICDAVLAGTTAAATALRLTADGAAAGAANTVNLPSTAIGSYSLRITLTALDLTTPTNTYSWSVPVAILTKTGTANSTTVLTLGTPVTLATNAWAPTVSATADTTNGGLNLNFTPPSGNTDTVHVVARVESIEVQ